MTHHYHRGYSEVLDPELDADPPDLTPIIEQVQRDGFLFVHPDWPPPAGEQKPRPPSRPPPRKQRDHHAEVVEYLKKHTISELAEERGRAKDLAVMRARRRLVKGLRLAARTPHCSYAMRYELPVEHKMRVEQTMGPTPKGGGHVEHVEGGIKYRYMIHGVWKEAFLPDKERS